MISGMETEEKTHHQRGIKFPIDLYTQIESFANDNYASFTSAVLQLCAKALRAENAVLDESWEFVGGRPTPAESIELSRAVIGFPGQYLDIKILGRRVRIDQEAKRVEWVDR